MVGRKKASKMDGDSCSVEARMVGVEVVPARGVVYQCNSSCRYYLHPRHIEASARSHREGADGHRARRVPVEGIDSFVHLCLPLSLLVFPCTLIPCASSTGSLFPLLYRTIELAPQNRFLTFCVHETRPSENTTVSLFRTRGHRM